MGGLLKAIFGGGDDSKKMLQEQQKQREMTQIAQARQGQEARDNSSDTAGQLAAAKSVRGQRLLLSGNDGGLATTVGAA